MTLTEQLKNGQLKAGWYYVLLFSNEEYIAFIDGNWVVDDRLVASDIKEVLAPVPAFDEYQQLRKFLEEFNALDVAKENQQLKELLKECREEIDKARNILTEDTSIDNTVIAYAALRKLLVKIDDTIGEKK